MSAALFSDLRERGFVSADQPLDAVGEREPWLSEVALPFWREMAKLADVAGLPVLCDVSYIMWEDWTDAVDAGVYQALLATGEVSSPSYHPRRFGKSRERDVHDLYED